MRRRVVLVFSLTLAAAPFGRGVRPAFAGDCSGVYSPCVNDDTLWPHAGAARFTSVGSTETIAPGQIGFGLVSTYLSRPVVLTIPAPAPPGSQAYAIDDQVNANFLFSYGVTKRLELDLVLPVTFGQGGTGLAPITGGLGLKDTALRDIRFGFAYAIIPHVPSATSQPSDGFGLAARVEVSAPTGDHDQLAGERSAAFAPGVAGALRQGRLFAGLELGARVRPTTEIVGARIGTQLFSALGVGYDLLPRQLLSLTAEAWALPTLAEQHDIQFVQPGVPTSVGNGRHIVPAEWQLSVRTAPLRSGDVSIQAGGGGAIPLDGETPITTPRFRFTLGVRWAPTSRSAEVAPSEPAPAPPPASGTAGAFDLPPSAERRTR